MRKWHYFNEDEELCKLAYYPILGPKVVNYKTACGRRVSLFLLYTEDKQQVNCLQCLHILNKLVE